MGTCCVEVHEMKYFRTSEVMSAIYRIYLSPFLSYKHIYVYPHIYIYTHMYLPLSASLHLCMNSHTCIYIYIYTKIYICISIRIFTYQCLRLLYVSIYIYTHTACCLAIIMALQLFPLGHWPKLPNNVAFGDPSSLDLPVFGPCRFGHRC